MARKYSRLDLSNKKHRELELRAMRNGDDHKALYHAVAHQSQREFGTIMTKKERRDLFAWAKKQPFVKHDYE